MLSVEQERQATGLMTRSQQGDALAYAELLTMLATVARRYARNRLGEVAWIDDVSQEALLAVHGARHTYDPRRPFMPWFYAILSSRMIDVLRRERRISTRELGVDALPEPPRSGGAAAASHELDLESIRAALQALPARQREVVRALKLGDESVREVGARLGMSESAVKVTAHRGYRALRRLLRSRDS